MTAIHIKSSSLVIRAGAQALAHIRKQGLSPADVGIIPGAAGGPKALGLQGLDIALFGEWLPRSPRVRALIGASIGAWRSACICMPDPAKSLRQLGELYTGLNFPKGIAIGQISQICESMLDELLKGRDEAILTAPNYRLNIMIVQALGTLASDQRRTLSLGLGAVIRDNLIARSRLIRHFSRIVAHDLRQKPPLDDLNDFPTQYHALRPDNLRQSLLASGSIPLVMEGVRDIPGFDSGTYRDGGLLDYHLDLPYRGNDIVLYPHFIERVIPGWFDKGVFWRKANAYNLRNVVLIAPSRSYLERLPNRKLPDRKDFTRYAADPATRQRHWHTAMAESQRLGDEFLELAESGQLKDRVLPLV
jgi:hypothetical protein